MVAGRELDPRHADFQTPLRGKEPGGLRAIVARRWEAEARWPPLRYAVPAARKPGVTIRGHPRDACVAPVAADGPKSDRLLVFRRIGRQYRRVARNGCANSSRVDCRSRILPSLRELRPACRALARQ